MATLKKKAWDWCSKYSRLRDALDYCRRMRIDISQFSRVEDIIVQCCTCDVIKAWINMDAGHFISRGLAGGSGVYFDERNINTQCKPCNGFRQSNGEMYREFMLRKYGQRTIDELIIKDKRGSKYSKLELRALAEFYKERYEELVTSI